MAHVPSAILQCLKLDVSTKKDDIKATLSSSNLGGFSRTATLHVTIPSKEPEERRYFVKTSGTGTAGKEMFRGEYESLNRISDIVPGFCPRGIGWGRLSDGDDDDGADDPDQSRASDETRSNRNTYFLVTEFLDISSRKRGCKEKTKSLATQLAALHSKPAPAPLDYETNKPMFGFPVPTFCGDTKQPNRYRSSWAEFYAHERLLMILAESELRNGKDAELRRTVEETVEVVVPALLADGHLGYDRLGRKKQDIYPVVVHGDLWSGNSSQGRIEEAGNRVEEDEDRVGALIYDPSACYAHNEYDLGIMHMFGGFGSSFFQDYHALIPKTEPVEEYDDRVKLYELYACFIVSF